MSKCHKCGKPVYFAERKTSLGKDWHPNCLRCAECGRILNPGRHADHRGIPYCHTPCYSVLFGPTVFGHGSCVEAHTSFGRAMEQRELPPEKFLELQNKLREYNGYYEGKNGQLSCKEANGRLVFEGLLRIHWGLEKPIQLKRKDDVPVPCFSRSMRRSYIMAIDNGLEGDLARDFEAEAEPPAEPELPVDLDAPLEQYSNTTLPAEVTIRDTNGIGESKVTLRRRNTVGLGDQKQYFEEEEGSKKELRRFHTVRVRGEKANRRKRFSINGHFYNLETSVFTPEKGAVTSVRVTSLIPAPEVIKLLLEKFKVENEPSEFSLCAVKGYGAVKVLREKDYPLIERVMMGALEDNGKIYIMEKDKAFDISIEVGIFTYLPDAVLQGLLEKLEKEENVEERVIRTWYNEYKARIRCRLHELDAMQV